ncbi:MAG: HD-GYP domain-containing protein [Thermodesulfobacteriota bacterium]
MRQGAAKFIRIAPEYLLAEDRAIDFDVYTRRDNRDRMILLAAAHSNISALKELLRVKQYGPLFITKEDYSRFQRFLEDSLGAVIANPRVPIEKKSALVHACARDVLRDVFADPRSGDTISRTKKVTGNLVNLTLAHRASILTLLSLGAHDYYTFSHCVNVAVFAIGLWQSINPKGEKGLQDFALGCILHDVGKTQVQDEILNKPGKLTPPEFEKIKFHPGHGFTLMEGQISTTSLDVILHHHEKVNGQGYPHGLSGEQISDHAKIATIADVYDALTTNRPYAGARLPFSALTTMKEEMVGHFEHDKFNEFILFLGGKK